MISIKRLLQDAASIVMPRNCPVCGKPLDSDERFMCRKCHMQLPVTHFHEIDFNLMEQLFAGKVPIERAAAYFYYEKSSPYASLLHDLKYRNQPQLGRWLARQAATLMLPSGLWDGIDVIIPVPLHITKLAKRGYNQSQHIAQGIADVTGTPVKLWLKARQAHSSQTKKDKFERMLSAQGLYLPTRQATAQLQGKHVLIVDDVVTTGATLLSCAQALHDAIPSIKISLFTLAAARLE